MANEQEQKSELVNQHKRLAMGVKLDGQSMKSSEKSEPNNQKGGALSQVKPNK